MIYPARIGFLSLFISVLLTNVSGATLIERLSFVELTRQADLIVEASVETGSKRTEMRDGVPWTCITLRVLQNLKGNAGPQIEPCFLGGVMGTHVFMVDGQRIPEEGKRGFFFLSDIKKGNVNPLVGWGQGIFYISTDQAGRSVLTTARGATITAISLTPSAQADRSDSETASGVATSTQIVAGSQDPHSINVH